MRGALIAAAVVMAGLVARPELRGTGTRRLRALRPAASPLPARSLFRSLLRAVGHRPVGELTPAAVAALAERVAGLCRAGLPLTRVWAVLAEHDRAAPGACARVARTVALGGSPAEGLRLAAPPGGGSLGWLAAACAVAERSGAPVADVLDGLATVIRDQEEAGRQRAAALAGPRATATLLAWLPLAGLALGGLTGVDAIGVLLTTAAGRGCLLTGGLFWAAGGWWMRRLLRRGGARAGAR